MGGPQGDPVGGCDYRPKYPEKRGGSVVTNGRYDNAECHYDGMAGVSNEFSCLIVQQTPATHDNGESILAYGF